MRTIKAARKAGLRPKLANQVAAPDYKSGGSLCAGTFAHSDIAVLPSATLSGANFA
jgi:hypothetical protein